MIIELKVPTVGESITEVEIGGWLKPEGGTVVKEESVVTIETEKATVDLPAPAAGKLARILKKTGERAVVGETIGLLEAGAAETVTQPPPPPRPPKSEASAATNTPVRSAAETNPRADEIPASASVGRLGALPASPAREEQVVRMSLLRRTIARRLVEAQQSAALLTTFNEADMSAIIVLRQQYQETFQQKYGVKLGFMSFFVKAVIDALKQVPQLNAAIRGEDIVYRNYHDIGLAVSSDRGLVVPVLRGAERLSFAEIEQAIADFAKRARDNKLLPTELEGGTFTISNGGVFGSLLSTPLVNPPQSGVLGMHAIQERPVAVSGQVVIRPMMYVALTYDHRIVDGSAAVLFLRRVKEGVENPTRLLLEI